MVGSAISDLMKPICLPELAKDYGDILNMVSANLIFALSVYAVLAGDIGQGSLDVSLVITYHWSALVLIHTEGKKSWRMRTWYPRLKKDAKK